MAHNTEQFRVSWETFARSSKVRAASLQSLPPILMHTLAAPIESFASKVGRQRGMRSVPPGGNGWVQPIAFENLANSHADHQPTRYCVVVLTSCHVDDRLLRQSPAKRKLFQTVLHQARLVKRRSSSSVTDRKST